MFVVIVGDSSVHSYQPLSKTQTHQFVTTITLIFMFSTDEILILMTIKCHLSFSHNFNKLSPKVNFKKTEYQVMIRLNKTVKQVG